jgi:hypothetical protein
MWCCLDEIFRVSGVMTPDVTAWSATLPDPLPAEAVLAHVGMHKTGTTAIQSVLQAARPELLSAGVSYPGAKEAHHLEARALTQTPLGWQRTPLPPPEPVVWDEFADAVRGERRRVVFSSEFFSSASVPQIEQMMRDLDGRGHIVIGVRNLGPVAVSSWQQTLKQGRISTLDGWLKGNFERPEGSDEPRFFWDRFDPGVTVTRYAQAAGPERVTVIVLREGERAMLPRTFERLLALPDGLLAGRTAPRSNRGLSAVEAEAVRQVNVALRGRLQWREYDALVRNGVIRRLVENRTPKPDEVRPELPEWVADQVRREGLRVAETITESGVRVVGDLADLSAPTAVALDDEPPALDTISVEAMVEAVVGSVASATHGTWDLDAPRIPGPPRISDATAVQLLGIVASRLGQRARRTLKGD